MKLVYLDTCSNHKMINAIAGAKIFETEDELKSYFKEAGYKSIDISSIGYKSKDICDEDIVELWGLTTDGESKMLGKIIRVIDERKFKKSITKWNKKNQDSYIDQFKSINTWIETM